MMPATCVPCPNSSLVLVPVRSRLATTALPISGTSATPESSTATPMPLPVNDRGPSRSLVCSRAEPIVSMVTSVMDRTTELLDNWSTSLSCARAASPPAGTSTTAPPFSRARHAQPVPRDQFVTPSPGCTTG